MPLFRAVYRLFPGHRSTRLTMEGALFLFMTLAIGVTAINTGNNLFYLLLAMMLSLILVSGIVAEHSLRRLTFHRHLPDTLVAGEPSTVTLVLTNSKVRFSSWSLRVLDVVEQTDMDRGLVVHALPPGATRLLSYELTAARRGRLALDGIRVVTTFPFGLFTKSRYYPVTDAAIVCPLIMTLPDELFQDQTGRGHDHQAHRRGYGTDLYNLRRYRPGDDSRTIHWISTARTSQLIVRETEAEDQQRATIHLSTIAPVSHEAIFENAVAFTASLAVHLARQGYHLRLIIGSDGSSFGQGDMHLNAMLHQLALCERQDPDHPLAHTDVRGLEHEIEGEAFLAVRPWEGYLDERANPTAVFTSEIFGEAGHVVR